jgi:hypothetical protein
MCAHRVADAGPKETAWSAEIPLPQPVEKPPQLEGNLRVEALAQVGGVGPLDGDSITRAKASTSSDVPSALQPLTASFKDVHPPVLAETLEMRRSRLDSALREAKELLDTTGVGTHYNLWDRLLDVLRIIFTLGRTDTRLINDKVFFGRLATRLAELPPDSPILTAVFKMAPWSLSDELARYLFETRGAKWINSLSIDARKALLQAVREGWATKGDRMVYNAVAGPLQRDDYEAGIAALKDPERLAQLRQSYQKLLDDGTGFTVKFAGTTIPASQPVPVTSSVLLDIAYGGVERQLREWSSPEKIRKTLAAKPVNQADGRPVHFETVIYRTGLSNVPPSAANLFRLAQHCDKLVLMSSIDDGTCASRLRPLGEDEGLTYLGAPIPQELRGKLFVMGRRDCVLQDYKAGASVLIRQLDTLRAQGAELGIDTDKITMVAYSQGNIETVLTRLVLAANGYPDVIKRHIAVAPTLRGSLLADNDALLDLLGRLSGGEAGERAIASEDPDTVEENVPELMRSTVDLGYLGLIDHGTKPEVSLGALKLGRQLSEAGLGGKGGDGLVDCRVESFANDPNQFHIASGSKDHLATVLTSPDEMLGFVQDYNPSSLWALQRLAEPAQAQTEPPLPSGGGRAQGCAR